MSYLYLMILITINKTFQQTLPKNERTVLKKTRFWKNVVFGPFVFMHVLVILCDAKTPKPIAMFQSCQGQLNIRLPLTDSHTRTILKKTSCVIHKYVPNQKKKKELYSLILLFSAVKVKSNALYIFIKQHHILIISIFYHFGQFII